jgi:putative hydrolase
MSLLEGHADVMMDEVGSDVLPTVANLREKLQRRRTQPSGKDAFVRRLMGMESKLAQYRDGAAFVRGVIAEAGVDGFNTVWTSPETLPSRTELFDPSAWLERVGQLSS